MWTALNNSEVEGTKLQVLCTTPVEPLESDQVADGGFVKNYKHSFYKLKANSCRSDFSTFCFNLM